VISGGSTWSSSVLTLSQSGSQAGKPPRAQLLLDSAFVLNESLKKGLQESN